MSVKGGNQPWSLSAFHNSASRAGLIAIPPETTLDGHHFTPVSTNYAQVAYSGVISRVAFRTAAIANYAQGRIRNRSKMLNWAHTRKVTDQTGQLIGREDFAPVNIPFKDGNLLEAQADNATNAQVESAIFLHGLGRVNFFSEPPIDAIPVDFTATTALVANVFSNPGLVTWSYEFDAEKTYDVVGLLGHSATGYALRLLHKSAPWNSWRPGVLSGDTNVL
ncbi:unnamed protein product, partial [marine sediment metagenome]